MKAFSIALILAAVAATWSCAGGTGTQVGKDDAGETSGGVDVLQVEQASDDVVPEAISPGDIVGVEAELPFDLGPGPEGLLVDLGPMPGEAGAPCSIADDCDDGFCISTADGKRCSKLCEEECPFGWECVPYTPSLPDPVSICAPRFVDLCRPCKTNSDCTTNKTDQGQACVAAGNVGAYCGEACAQHSDCPDGYGCLSSVDVTGAAVMQCVLSGGECKCSENFKDEAATTTCFVENEHGKCAGERMCTATGLTACSAKTPQKEACNSLDDDCDGTADEEAGGGSCPIVNVHGTCPGIGICLGGVAICQGEEAAPELCDGKDNDCDGSIDENFPDTDDDGVCDDLEKDKDGDGIVDALDNCPSVFNAGQKDFDLDLLGDVCDPDDDNDLSPDDVDCFPFDKEAFPGGKEVCDGKDNDCNFSVDEGFTDADGDGLKDCVDEDDDNDGALDAKDCGALDPGVGPDAQEECDGKDNDCDFAVDEGFPDSDQDGKADCSDADQDGDGVENKIDNCPSVSNQGQEDADGDAIGDACDSDADGDSIPDKVDNCAGLKNTAQTDTDGDGLGDPCDSDQDGDGVPGKDDNCPFVPNPGQTDTDLDGVGDACEDDQDGDGAKDAKDCEPLNPEVHPGAVEDCDGLDNDCDFAQDEGFPDTDLDGLKDCVDDDDDGDGDPDETDCEPLNAAVNDGAADVCDGLDNDCDGKPDDGLGSTWCGKGMCAHSSPVCVAGKTVACDPMQGAQEETCDGLDNDCDGMKDEDLGTTTCGLGICVHTVVNCIGGVPNLCDPLEGAAVEVCDGFDNDCDAKTDEGLGLLACGQGICFHTVKPCEGGEPQECDPMKGATIEVCDGLDNDCDGAVDKGLGVVTCGKGACQHEQDYCTAGKVTICDPFLGVQEEVCDAIDNDCNGLTDEKLGLITCGEGVCMHSVQACVAGVPQSCQPFDGASEEICDGLDNDCDGLVDELGLVTCGAGQCLHTVAACEDGEENECDPLDGATQELCDGLDNDCNGSVDPENSLGCNPYYLDSDADGAGSKVSFQCLCVAAPPYTALSGTDCDDGDPNVNPGANEACKNAADENCNDQVNEGCVYASCKEALQYNPNAPSGSYTIDTDGAGAAASFAVYCDMKTDGGGWTLVMKQASNQGYGSPLSVSVWNGWGTPNVTMNPTDATMDDANMVNAAYSTLIAEKLRMTASQTWTDTAAGAWMRTINNTAYNALANAAGNQTGAEGPEDTTPWAAAPFTDHTWTSVNEGYGLCWRSGPWFNRTSYEYTSGGIKWGWLFNNECGPSSTDTAEGLGCCGNSSWYRKSPWVLYVWAR